MTGSLSSHKRIVAIAGSLSSQSTTAKVAEVALEGLSSFGDTSLVRLNEIPSAALFAGDRADAAFARALSAVEEADGVVLATPIYKASMSGLMKLFLDHLPQYGFAGKTVWPIATGGSLAHTLALDYGVRPILQSMGPRLIIQSCFISPEQGCAAASPDIADVVRNDHRFQEALLHFQAALASEQPFQLLGHPIPDRSASALDVGAGA